MMDAVVMNWWLIDEVIIMEKVLNLSVKQTVWPQNDQYLRM